MLVDKEKNAHESNLHTFTGQVTLTLYSPMIAHFANQLRYRQLLLLLLHDKLHTPTIAGTERVTVLYRLIEHQNSSLCDARDDRMCNDLKIR